MAKIVHVAAELSPIAKVGGLADVLTGLSRELARAGHEVEVMIPEYDCLDYEGIIALEKSAGFKITLVNPGGDWFQRGCFYGCVDDISRYLAFSRAAVELMVDPEIIHLHDWQAAVAAPLIRARFPDLRKSKIVFTIHNVEHQGSTSPDTLDAIEMEGKDFLTLDRMADNYDPGRINLMKGGIVYSDVVTTVSPRYAEEVMSPVGGRGLEETFRLHREKFRGVLNGIDTVYWDPAKDKLLPKKIKDPSKRKAHYRQEVRKQFGMAQEERPIVATVTRLVPQKGIDLIKHAIGHTVERGGQFILLGTSPIPEIQADFERLRDQNADNPHVHLELSHDEQLAHWIYAAADLFFVPSLFEPCGLTQLIAMRYGAVPVVRETGGLADTVVDIDYSGKELENCNGYTFRDPDLGGVESALDRALGCWQNEPDTWKKLVDNGLREDHSWSVPARHYEEVYGIGR